MDLNLHIGLFRIPARFILAGEGDIEIYTVNNKKMEKTGGFDGLNVFNLNSRSFRDMLGVSPEKTEIGMVLNSNPFIFNILEFDKIPFREQLRKDLIEWKIKKIFPEDISHYQHEFFRLSSRRLLSVLLKKDLKQKIEKLVNDSNHSLTYLGNSTIEIMNHVFRGKSVPDFFMEVDKQLLVVVFQHRSIPYYIRKFRVETGDEIKEEMLKTLRYVASTFGMKPRNYAVVSRNGQIDREKIRRDLAAAELKEMSLPHDSSLYLPISK
jgi:hypothetical protein